MSAYVLRQRHKESLKFCRVRVTLNEPILRKQPICRMNQSPASNLNGPYIEAEFAEMACNEAKAPIKRNGIVIFCINDDPRYCLGNKKPAKAIRSADYGDYLRRVKTGDWRKL